MLVTGAEARGERRDDERARTGAQRLHHGEHQRVVEREEVSLARHHHRLDRLSPAAADGDTAAADAAGEREQGDEFAQAILDTILTGGWPNRLAQQRACAESAARLQQWLDARGVAGTS